MRLRRDANLQKTLDDLDTDASGPELPSRDRYVAAMALSAIGDALGWPTEYLPRSGSDTRVDLPLHDYIEWRKNVGGHWWGYQELIRPGEYSDDTQLSLAIARSVSESGEFEPERFAYLELPLWLHYERGGGHSVKTASRNLLRNEVQWSSNFYGRNGADYRSAGANGAAMRNLPIALVHVNSENALVTDSFRNAIITHGHPRAIIGAVLFALAVRLALLQDSIVPSEFTNLVGDQLRDSLRQVSGSNDLIRWQVAWQDSQRKDGLPFTALYDSVLRETNAYLSSALSHLSRPTEDYYDMIGALSPATRGSGIASVCAAIYLFLKEGDDPEAALYHAVNLLGSDTDTVANFLGALLGARHGTKALPRHLWDKLQDREYIEKTAERLHAIAAGAPRQYAASKRKVGRRDGALRVLAWEIGLHEMFWDAIEEGGYVVHPTLGRGRIGKKEVKSLRRAGYIAKLLHVAFDSGQTCVFHSRVHVDGKLSESFSGELVKEFGDDLGHQPARRLGKAGRPALTFD